MKFKHKATGAIITCIRWTGTDQSYGYIQKRLKKVGIDCRETFGSLIVKGPEGSFDVPDGYWIWFSDENGKPIMRYHHADLHKRYEPIRK